MADKTPVIQDLDVLRPTPEYVRLGGKDIDISFVPAGVAIDILGLQDQMTELAGSDEAVERLTKDRDASVRLFDLQAEYCAKLTSAQFPEMDKDWLLKHTSVRQLKILIARVTSAVTRSLAAVEDEEVKKASAAEGTSP